MMIRSAIPILALLLTSCGGSEAPIRPATAQTQAQATPDTIETLHCILRPDAAGRWYIQDDVDHAPVGIVSVTQAADSLTIQFARVYTHAVSIQITSDDDFRSRVQGFGNLGLSGSRITIEAGSWKIDPARVNEFVPAGSGNLWVTATMMVRR